MKPAYRSCWRDRHWADQRYAVRGPGVISDDVIARLRSQPRLLWARLYSLREQAAPRLSTTHSIARPAWFRLFATLDPAEHEIMAQRDPRLKRIQIVHVSDRACLNMIPDYAPYVHAFLLDSGWPDAAVSPNSVALAAPTTGTSAQSLLSNHRSRFFTQEA